MKDIFKKIFRKAVDEDDYCQLKNDEDIILMCGVINRSSQFSDAIKLYESFENEIMESKIDINDLKTKLKIC